LSLISLRNWRSSHEYSRGVYTGSVITGTALICFLFGEEDHQKLLQSTKNQLLEEERSYFRGGDHAGFLLSKPTVPVFCNDIISEIPDKCGEDPEDTGQFPERTQLGV
jgi:hypothetical protein